MSRFVLLRINAEYYELEQALLIIDINKNSLFLGLPLSSPPSMVALDFGCDRPAGC